MKLTKTIKCKETFTQVRDQKSPGFLNLTSKKQILPWLVEILQTPIHARNKQKVN